MITPTATTSGEAEGVTLGAASSDTPQWNHLCCDSLHSRLEPAALHGACSCSRKGGVERMPVQRPASPSAFALTIGRHDVSRMSLRRAQSGVACMLWTSVWLRSHQLSIV